MKTSEGNGTDPLTQFIFSSDPLDRFRHEKVWGGQRRSTDDPALRALILAVLEDAIACFQGYFFRPSRTNEKLFLEAEEWISSNDDDDVFSFSNICETLGLDPDALRKGLRRWQVEKIHKVLRERNRLVPNKGKRPTRKTREPKNV